MLIFFEKVKKSFGYLVQALFVVLVYTIFRFIISFRVGSNSAGYIARKIGPLASASKIARQNIKQALPDKTDVEIEQIIQEMWENMGRTLIEYCRLPSLDLYSADSPVEVVGVEQIEALRDDQKPGLLFLGHLGNWEYATLVGLQRGLQIYQVYRTLNNPFVARFIDYVHGRVNKNRVTKGQEGARQSLKILQKGHHLSMLIDQKLNEGIPIPFFGRDAMTAPALARLALKFNCPLVPVRVERLEGIKCRVTYYPPLKLPEKGSIQEKTRSIMAQVNQMLEAWIRERPSQWMWIHNRWPI